MSDDEPVFWEAGDDFVPSRLTEKVVLKLFDRQHAHALMPKDVSELMGTDCGALCEAICRGRGTSGGMLAIEMLATASGFIGPGVQVVVEEGMPWTEIVLLWSAAVGEPGSGVHGPAVFSIHRP
jgi:hypothetical protein